MTKDDKKTKKKTTVVATSVTAAPPVVVARKRKLHPLSQVADTGEKSTKMTAGMTAKMTAMKKKKKCDEPVQSIAMETRSKRRSARLEDSITVDRDGQIISADGTQKWHQNGKLHRDGDLPAIIWADGTQEWYQNGELHRDGGKPAFVDPDGHISWWKNGLCTCACWDH